MCQIVNCKVKQTLNVLLLYKVVQRFRVTCLFTGQYDTEEYGTIAGVILK